MDLAEMSKQHMHTGVASSLGYSVLIETNSAEVYEYYSEAAKRSIPGYSFVPNGEGAAHLALSVTEASAESRGGLNLQGDVMSLVFPAGKLWWNDLEFILLFLFSHLYFGKSIVLTHAVGLRSPEDVGVMIAGEAGSGKSITSVKLMQRGFQTLGNDRLLLSAEDEVAIIGGSRPIRLRGATVNRYFPELGHGSDDWGTFRTYQPIELGIQESGPTKLDLLIFAKVAPIGQADCTCHEFTELHGDFTLVRIYQLLSFFSDPAQLVMISTRSMYPAFEPEDVSSWLLGVAGKVAEQAAIYEVYGNLEYVVDCVESLARELGGGRSIR